MTAERSRLDEAREGRALWKKWGRYLSERQSGTVRDDYSANGDAWNAFPLPRIHHTLHGPTDPR